MGTATYFSPEQAQGLPLDPRSDLYSLGVVLYEMVTGRPPFSGDSPVAIAYKHVQEPPTPPRHVNLDVPAALEAIIMQAAGQEPGRPLPVGRGPARRPAPLPRGPVGAGQPRPRRCDATSADRRRHAGGAGLQRRHPHGARRGRCPATYQPPRRTGAFLVVLVILLLVLAGLLVLLRPRARASATKDDDRGPGGGPVGDRPRQDGRDRRARSRGLRREPRRPSPTTTSRWASSSTRARRATSAVDEGSTVTIRVSAGADTVPMPNVVGPAGARGAAAPRRPGLHHDRDRG